jgi:hypothetical protein
MSKVFLVIESFRHSQEALQGVDFVFLDAKNQQIIPNIALVWSEKAGLPAAELAACFRAIADDLDKVS